MSGSNSMVHWNGNQVCVIDTETTGLKAGWHEIIQICVLALDSNLKPRRDVMPFYIEIIPEHPERIDPDAMRVNGLKLTRIAQTGHDSESAKDLLEDWVGKLGLPFTKFGRRKRILPLGQNYAFDKGFIEYWLGIERYSESFDYHDRDTMHVANYLNDRAGMHAEKTPFSKVNLKWLANKLNVKYEKAHDALSDCVTTAEVYRRMLQRGLLG